MFPSNFVTLLETEEPRVAETVPALPPKPQRELARVLFAYNPSQPDELELKEGEIVTILSKNSEDKGWWKGEVNGKVSDTHSVSWMSNFQRVFRLESFQITLSK